jgi:hypothetical protein
MKYKKWNLNQKLEILSVSEDIGIVETLKRYVAFYNNERLHGLLVRFTPMEIWNNQEHLILMKNRAA